MTDRKTFARALQPDMVIRSLQTFDRSNILIVGIAWAVAFLMIVLALYAFHVSRVSQERTIQLVDSHPSSLQINHELINHEKAQFLADQFQKLYPDLKFATQDSHILVSSNDGTKFRQWLSALHDINAAAPSLRWSIDKLCVGKCPAQDIMSADLIAENIVFSSP